MRILTHAARSAITLLAQYAMKERHLLGYAFRSRSGDAASSDVVGFQSACEVASLRLLEM